MGRGKAYLNIPDEKIIKYLNPTPGPLSMLFPLHSYYFTFKCKNVSMLFPLPSSHIISHIISSICEKCLCLYSHSVRKLLDVPGRYKLFVPKFVSTLAKMSHNVRSQAVFASVSLVKKICFFNELIFLPSKVFCVVVRLVYFYF